ncbi:hypothetical protein DLM76_17150 [Leptospira yasudae]|nr:hypothetical protein DLM76_17150 [Leptospira yasudae]
MTTIFMSFAFGALVTLIAVISKDAYRDFRNSQLFNLPPDQVRFSGPIKFSKEEEDRIKKETIEIFANAPGDLAYKLEGFLESLKFHDQILDRIFQENFGSPDYYVIGRDLESLINQVELRIRISKEESSYGTPSN